MKIGPIASPFSNNVSNLNAKKGRPLTDSEVLAYASQYGVKLSGSRKANKSIIQKVLLFQENKTNQVFKPNTNTENKLESLQKQFSTLQTKYSNKEATIPDAVQTKLNELGLTSTGSYEGDMVNIQNNFAAQNAASIQNPYYLNPNYILWFGK